MTNLDALKPETNLEDLPDFKDLPVTMTKPPHPDWRPGQGAVAEVSGKGHDNAPWKTHAKIGFDPYDPTRGHAKNYFFAASGITPRPIGLVSTESKTGHRNLAPFTYFQVVSNDPLVFVLGISQNSGKIKDTSRNLQETGEATVSIISEWFVEAANYTNITLPPSLSEWKVSGLTPVESLRVKPPHVLESAISFEVKVRQTIPIEDVTTPGKINSTVFLLQCEYVHVREDIVDDPKNPGKVDLQKLRPVSRLGGVTYGRTTETFELPKFFYDANNLSEDLEKIL
ncbi:uncharacterized protein SAPINGB_P006261 [Magnusiomyces paraingens]|uniref:Flavin reductase like domain-containing protein n=1 Tax=Magnusiomyces paraingens TaxID=2606893 RepID=A0A5E8C577_9ASCO|nr:uncharacterized protein SAPINGB_P006261 [Saprochaete ingens]VVT58542.1 unnamed protein product [Saprochaete ingens]